MSSEHYRHLTYNTFVVRLARWLVVPFLRWFFRTSVSGLENVSVKPPYVLLASHANVWDPLVYNVSIKVPVHFVVSHAQFRLPFMRFVLGLVGSIAKRKSRADINALVEIMHVLKRRSEVVCIFPEGVNTWDGHSSEIVGATAKFIKHTGLPVLCARSHGAYLSFPRWACGARRGRWHVHYALCLTPQRIKNLNEEAILTCIKKALYNDEYKNQHVRTMHFISSKAAEYIERVLFACPYCEMVQSIVSEKTFFYCRVCCNMWRFRADGFIQRRRHGPMVWQEATEAEERFTTVAQWNTWQQKFLERLLKKKWGLHDSAFFFDQNVQLLWGRTRLVGGSVHGVCELNHDEFVFTSHRGGTSSKIALRIAIADMASITVENNERLEWTSKCGHTYQLRSKNPRVNTYKYMCAVRLLQSNK